MNQKTASTFSAIVSRAKIFRFIVAGALAVVSLATPGRAAMLTVTEVMSSSGVTPDWFELTNISTQNIDLTGYTIDDNSFSFAASVALNNVTALLPGQSAVFIESAAGASDIALFRSYWGLPATALIGNYSGSMVGLSSTADGVVVFNGAGTEVTPRAIFGAATNGASFYFDRTSGAASGISATGQPGVFTSANTYNGVTAATNVGSPEFGGAVPEPGTFALATVGLAGVVLFVRRARKIAA